MTGTAIAPVSARTLPPCPSRRLNAHPCNIRPDLYPTGGLPLDAGLIHREAANHLARFIHARLQESGCEHPAVVKDVLLHTDREERAHSGAWAYTRPSILAYKSLRADREPANAFHLGYDGPPDLVVEILSASTMCKDGGVGGDIADKTEYYRSVGVSEYWIYNPELRQRQKGIRFFTGSARGSLRADSTQGRLLAQRCTGNDVGKRRSTLSGTRRRIYAYALAPARNGRVVSYLGRSDCSFGNGNGGLEICRSQGRTQEEGQTACPLRTKSWIPGIGGTIPGLDPKTESSVPARKMAAASTSGAPSCRAALTMGSQCRPVHVQDWSWRRMSGHPWALRSGSGRHRTGPMSFCTA